MFSGDPTPSAQTRAGDDQVESLVRVLELIRSGRATTRPEIARVSGYGRTVIAQRVQQLLFAGLVTEGPLATSTGGRAARRLVFAAASGFILVAELGATHVSAGVATLSGEILASVREDCQIGHGPDVVLGRVEQLFDSLLVIESLSMSQIWGVGIGVPGPVEYTTGEPVSPPIMPGWDRYPIRARLSSRYDAPVWVDNDVNLMTLGELRRGVAVGELNVLLVKVGSGIGAGLVSNGTIHRGAQGAAGDVGHIEVEHNSVALCRCGNYGCLEAVAGGMALIRAAEALARRGEATFSAGQANDSSPLTFLDLSTAAAHGDPTVRGLIDQSALMVGQMLATLVNFHNPSLVVIAGQVALSSDSYLARVREVVLRRSLPLATRELRIEPSSLLEEAGLLGAASLVIDELLGSAVLALWIQDGTPVPRRGQIAS